MRTKGLIAGVLSLVVGGAWLALLVAQWPRLALAREIVLGTAGPILIRLFVLPSILLAAAGVILVLPLLLRGAGAMLGLQACVKVLRMSSQIGLATSAAVVVAFGVALLPTFGGTGARLGQGATLELAGAANLLILHGALLWVVTRYQANAGLRTA